MARSKEFEIDDVLEKAMNLFWLQGYEKTSMQDLVTGMGIHKRSMYDTFGDKHSLYMKAVERYGRSAAERMKEQAEAQPTVKKAIRSLFEMVLRNDTERPRGCLMVNTAVELSLHDPEVDSLVQDSFLSSERLMEKLVLSGQVSGEISRKQEAPALAAYLHNALVGLRVMVKTGQDPSRLEQIMDITLTALD
ncbi:TetR family transcriptional regulator [Bacillus sp. FJAT-27264]|uniref:TetR/AcrR family transcriptional regulator n=1 Tax=Paenibacillus sp. (strain DSM 101736 / FJAT-27264) TaxID=1850362 RepID=UPI0008080365|nr:TetR/AcrR family transcriptional regulator [Bacillus sp. FJAT-27264]OBZ19023.1 TetR family transcriptional regulator [Bacillus sp. FJAT-27264]